MTPSPDLSVVIPAYNEAARLPPTLERLRAYLGHGPLAYEIVVVDDGSTDETAEVARAARGDRAAQRHATAARVTRRGAECSSPGGRGGS